MPGMASGGFQKVSWVIFNWVDFNNFLIVIRLFSKKNGVFCFATCGVLFLAQTERKQIAVLDKMLSHKIHKQNRRAFSYANSNLKSFQTPGTIAVAKSENRVIRINKSLLWPEHFQ